MRKMNSQASNRRARQRGVVMIEFMIVAPLLLLLLLAITEFGHALYQYNSLTKSVRDGARYLSEHAMLGITGSIVISDDDITETQNLVVYGTTGTGTPILPGLAPAQVTVSCLGGGTLCPGVEHVVVSAQYPYQPIMGAVFPMLGFGSDLSLGLTLNSSVTMRAL